jgi:crotonobetainyl-CoA:carnitine CoA-transferase CaiB-like acyl-CoA transferase
VSAGPLREAWAALGGGAPGEVTVTSGGRRFGGRFDCDGLLRACAGSALLAAARGLPRPAVGLDGGGLALAAVSERYAAVGGRPSPPAFAPLSRFVATADGHVRLHANYPHHRAAVLTVLAPGARPGPPPGAGRRESAAGGSRPSPGEAGPAGGAESALEAAALEAAALEVAVASAARAWRAEALEAAVIAAGGCAAAVRTPAQWAGHPQARWSATRPLVTWSDRPPAPPLPPPTGPLPAAGLRVLDLTRVIAGPVATRTLAALGADVLRLGHPDRPELELHIVDGLVGKRAARLDLAATDRLENLLAGADVLVTGYRPGALDRFGLAPDAVARRHPHLVDVRLSAWGDGGPWGTRRGFDSLVQAATGIATTEGDGPPGVLPAQALDHGTGYLAAAAALRALTARARGAGPRHARLTLARTAAWLLAHPADPAPTILPDPAPWLLDLPTEGPARITAVRPPGTLDGVPLTWTHARTHEHADPPAW